MEKIQQRLDQVYPSKKKRCSLSGTKTKGERRASLEDVSPNKKGSLDGFIVSTKSPVSSTVVADSVDQRRAVVDPNSAVKTSLCTRIETCSTSNAENVQLEKDVIVYDRFQAEDQKREQFVNDFLSICFSGISPSKKVAISAGHMGLDHEEPILKKCSTELGQDRNADEASIAPRAEESIQTAAKSEEIREAVADNGTPEGGKPTSSIQERSAKRPSLTPHSSNEVTATLTPIGRLLENKYASPGDSFWDEAIRLLGTRPDNCLKSPVHGDPCKLQHDSPSSAATSNKLLASPLPVRCFDFAENAQPEDPMEVTPGGFQHQTEVDARSKDEMEASKDEKIISKGNNNVSLEQLSDWLPPEICQSYSRKGLKKLYEWQVECLRLDGVLDGKSLVYCASTSAGKSLVAEVLMVRRILATGKKAMLVLPYVALCSEKTEHLESILEPVGKRVRGFFGTQGSASLPSDTSIAVCTIEKANSLVNRLLEEGRLSELAVVVIDELHMVGDKERGYLLELMLTKLRYAAGKGEALNSTPDTDPATSLQIIGMSATMPNVAAVASWLQAAFYQTEFRPVPLDEYIKVGSVIYNLNMEAVRTIREGAELGGKDPDHIVQLCHEVVREGHSALLFCSSRHACETSARHVAKYLPKFAVVHKSTIGYKDGNEAVEELRKCPAGLDAVLADTLPAGVAYHHAGLTAEEREVVETCYRQGIVRVLTATSTLAAGVNLPARRVIFRQPKVGLDFLDGTRYRQMAGRAGRAGIDTHGESILICKPEELNRMLPNLKEGCQPLQSCLTEEKNGMMRALLEVVAGGIVQTAQDVNRYVRCTLLNSTQPFDDVVKSAQDSLKWLCHKRLIEWDQQLEMYKTTPLGKAAFGSSLRPEESLVVFEDLAKARESFVLASDLHLVYEVTPIHVELEPNWGVYYQRFVELSHVEQAVANRVGVTEASLMRMAHGAPMQTRKRNIRSPLRNEKTSDQDQTLRVYRRFYVALILSKLVQEVPLMEVCERFKVPRGTVQALQEISGRFAAMVSSFCERLGWHDLEGLISKFQNRVSFGVRAEIVGLTEIPFVKAARARALYKAGLRTVEAVAEATMAELTNALSDISSKGTTDARQGWMHAAAAKKIKNGARRIVLERAEEARKAAFSAFQALGVTVPQLLSQSLFAKIQETDADTEHVAVPEATVTAKRAVPENIFRHNEKENKPETSAAQDAFGGCLIKEGVDVQPAYQIHRCEDLQRGPVDVDKMEGGFQAFIGRSEGSQEFFFDFHFEDHSGIHGLAICWDDSPVYYVRLTSSRDPILRWSKLCSIFCTEGVKKFTWDLQKQMKVLGSPAFSSQLEEAIDFNSYRKPVLKSDPLSPMTIQEPYIDVRVVSWLLWPDEENNLSSSLEQLVKKRLPGEIAAAASKAGRWTNQMGKAAHNGCCRRAAQIRGLHSVLWKLLISESLHDPLLQLEMPLVRVLSDMETWPIGVNMNSCLTARHLLETRLKQLESKAQIMAGMNFSLSLPADVADLLYRHLKLPVPPGCAKGKQHPSTDKQALDQLRDRHPVVSLIKEHRSLSKLLHTTIGAVLSCAKKPAKGAGDTEQTIHYIYGRWLHTSTGTGRLSMEDPNLQCVEHSISFLLEDAATSETRQVEVNARQFFVPTQDGWILMSADYSQIELRLMAHFSQDEALVALLRRPTGDVFRMMTAKWTGQAEGDITDKQRERTKRMVYGILYGMGINSLAEKMECSVAEASRYHEQFKAAFPGVSAWLQQVVQSCRRNGHVKTLVGRKRYLENINNSKRVDQAKAERQAVNSICQGSAADLIKMAMLNLHSALTGRSSKTLLYTDTNGNSREIEFTILHGRCRLLLQIHDELVLEVDKNIGSETAAIIKSCMEGAATLAVPLNVKLQVGPSWGQLEPLKS